MSVEEEETEYVEEVVYEDVEEEVEEEEEVLEGAPAQPEALVVEGGNHAPSGSADGAREATPVAEEEPPKPSAPEPEAEPTAEQEPSTAEPPTEPQLPTSAVPDTAQEASDVPATAPEPEAVSEKPVAAATEYDLKNLEAQAAKVAKDVQEVAIGVQQKFTAGVQSMFSGLAASGATVTASASISKVAGGLSNWWSSLDPLPQPKRDETAERIQSSSKASNELQDMFGLDADENLVELFKCKLLQTYACSHNQFTPAIQMAFQGTLYITDKHTCFSVEERGRKLPFKVAHAQTIKATRQRPARRGDLSDILRLETRDGIWLAFKDFDSGSSLDSALALVEHLMEG